MKIIECFSGIGAARKALINLNIPFQSIDSVEIDPKAVKSYNALYGENYIPTSVVGYNAPDVEIDLLIHGSPCQDFSIAGKQTGAEDGTRSGLMFETIRIIEEMGENKPKVVVWENVKNVLSKKMRPAFNQYLDEMKRLGYTNSYEVLDAREFGIPQARQRLFTVSTLDGNPFNFFSIKRTKATPIQELLESEVDDKYTITQPSMLRKIGSIDDGSGHSLKIITDHALTVTTKQLRCPNSGIVPINDTQYRLLTERECTRLMGFSDQDFEKLHVAHPGIKGKLNGTLYKQAGNSIVVNVLESLFEQINEKHLNPTQR